MTPFKKIAAGCLLSLGFICLSATVFNVIEQDKTQENWDKAWVGIVLGLPLTMAGGCLIWSLSLQNQQQKENYLRSKFFHLVEKGNGSVTALNFAMEATISGAEARKYLENYSKEFNADFEVTEEGNMIYKFAFLQSETNRQQLPEKHSTDRG